MNIKACYLLLVLLSLAMPMPSYGQSFDKIFSTAQERDYLDRLRKEMFAELTEAERMEALREPETIILDFEAPPTLIHMGGSVKRADGSHTVWLNGVPVNERQLPSNVRLEFIGGMGVLLVDTEEGRITLRPGQTLNASDGVIREDYELTSAQLQSIQRELARREALARPAPSRASGAAPATSVNVEVEEDDSASALVQQVVDSLRMLQQARDIQEALQ